jgi:precorrin-3B methylase
MLCHAVVEYLLAHYADRFQIYEMTMVSGIVSGAEEMIATTAHGIIRSSDLLICTNGYSDFTIDGERNAIGISAERGYM